MKIVVCKDCGKDEIVPDFTSEPWICETCQELHEDYSVQDFDTCRTTETPCPTRL